MWRRFARFTSARVGRTASAGAARRGFSTRTLSALIRATLAELARGWPRMEQNLATLRFQLSLQDRYTLSMHLLGWAPGYPYAPLVLANPGAITPGYRGGILKFPIAFTSEVVVRGV